MTCKDCIHYEMCENSPVMEDGCPYFKDKSLIVELPCKVGDEVVINGETYKCIGFSIAPPTNTVNLVNEKNKLYQPSIKKIAKLKELNDNEMSI